MTRTLNSFATTLPTSEGTVLTASSKYMTVLVQAVNTTESAATCELWVTNSSNTKQYCLFPSQSIAAYNGISDTSKHVILSGYKIRGLSNTLNAIYVEISVVEGVS